MKLIEFAKNFAADESGAVTVDWVVLTAAIVGLGIAVLTAISDEIGVVTDSIEADLNTAASDSSAILTNAKGN